MPEELLLPARRGTAVRVPRGWRFAVVNTHGTQVVDTWAFVPTDSSFTALSGEHMSVQHTRVCLRRLWPIAGDALYSSARRPLLTLLADTSPGRHDTLCAACDPARYALLGAPLPHDNCAENLEAALAALGLSRSVGPAGGSAAPPCPLNLFMHIPVDADSGEMRWCAPLCAPGDAVMFRAECDVVMVFSCCLMDVPSNPINANAPVRDCLLRLWRPEEAGEPAAA